MNGIILGMLLSLSLLITGIVWMSNESYSDGADAMIGISAIFLGLFFLIGACMPLYDIEIKTTNVIAQKVGNKVAIMSDQHSSMESDIKFLDAVNNPKILVLKREKTPLHFDGNYFWSITNREGSHE
jgi:hypothetical protein